jgi:ubiquinone/menaquinone biosynthesis C-methylase UbiE
MTYYDKISEGYNELHKEEQLKKVKIIIKELNIKRTEKILDVGCGTAFYSNLLKNYTGVDPSKGMLKQSKANVIQASAENLPFKDNEFDVVISITAAQNFKDLKKATKEIKRVAKKKIAISILKRSKKLSELKNLLKDFKMLEEDKDIIFLKKNL